MSTPKTQIHTIKVQQPVQIVAKSFLDMMKIFGVRVTSLQEFADLKLPRKIRAGTKYNYQLTIEYDAADAKGKAVCVVNNQGRIATIRDLTWSCMQAIFFSKVTKEKDPNSLGHMTKMHDFLMEHSKSKLQMVSTFEFVSEDVWEITTKLTHYPQ